MSVVRIPTLFSCNSPVRAARRRNLCIFDAAIGVFLTLLVAGGSIAQDDSAETPNASEESVAPSDQSDDAAQKTPDSAAPKDDDLLRFNFRYQPWKDVLDWFAEQSDLSLEMDSPPPGTFNYTDYRGYTPVEALDLLNGILLTKGYTLVRRGRMLMVVNLENGIPPNVVAVIPLSELDSRGEHELVQVVFPLRKLSAEEAMDEVQPLLGPQGSIIPLSKSKRLRITETAGRLRTIQSVLESVENPRAARGEMREFALEHRDTNEVLPIIRQMLGIAEESNILPDGSIRIAVDAANQRLIVQGDADKLRQLESVLQVVDVPYSGGETGAANAPQLEVYSVAGSDPASVLAVLQTLLAGDPEIRLATDPQTGNLVALARPTQHATIRATIAQMQRDGRQIDVIPLSNIDPQTAVLAINKLFGLGGETVDPTAPRVDADLNTRSLMVRANAAQLEQIRTLLEKLGETLDEDGLRNTGGNVRLLPLTGRAARSALYQLEQIWPTMRSNRIRVVTPSNSDIPAFRPGSDRSQPSDDEDREPRPGADDFQFDPLQELFQSNPRRAPAETPPGDSSTRKHSRVRAVFASQPDADVTESNADGSLERNPDDSVHAPATGETERKRGDARRPRGAADSPILVAPGSGGVLIASDDLEALDDFEELLTTIASRSTSGGREFAVYYLRFAKANVVAETVGEIFGGGGGDGGGGGILGDIAGAALGGGATGDLVGGLLGIGGGGGGGALSLGAIDVVPDMRLNALIVRAKPDDLDTLEQLLQILDQPTGAEDVEIEPAPRLIPVFNTSAEYIAGVLQQVYQDRMRSSGANGGRNEPSPEELIRALRGGGGRGGDSTKKEQEEASKMTIGIDAHSNSLVVRAPDPLFQEVSRLVTTLDTADPNLRSATKIVTLSAASPTAVQSALTALFGNSVTVTQSTPSSSESADGRSSGASNGAGPSPEEVQQRIQFFQRMQQMREGGGGRGRRSRGGGGGEGGRGGGGRRGSDGGPSQPGR